VGVRADGRSARFTWSARLGLVLACCAGAIDCSDREDGAGTDGGSGHSAVDAGPAAAGGGGSSGSQTEAGGAGGATPVMQPCHIPDDIAIEVDDADGGAPSDCHDVPRVIIANNCTGTICHYAGKDRRAGLDLMSACVADRLLGVTSSCQGKPLIDPDAPEQSFLLDKLDQEQPACGAHMPLGGHLPDAQVACLNAWVHAVIRSAAPRSD
jgi:hypothetical protein